MADVYAKLEKTLKENVDLPNELAKSKAEITHLRAAVAKFLECCKAVIASDNASIKDIDDVFVQSS